VVYCCLVLLARHMASKPATALTLELLPAAAVGAGLAEAVQHLTLVANGGSNTDSVTKASQ
jgi:hypothetical protein